MALPKAGVSLVVENDQQFKAALSEVNAGLKVNKQQMQLVTEQTKELDDRQAALKQRYDAAVQTLQSYKDKVTVLQNAYDNSVRREGEASKTTMQWRSSLISAQVEVERQKNLLNDLREEQENTNRSTASLADVVNGLADAFGVNLPPGMQSAVEGLERFSASGTAAVTVIGGMVAALGSSTVSMSQRADELTTLASQTGLTAEQLQELEYASEFVDVSVDSLQDSLKEMTNSMQSAREGSSDAAAAFKELDVKVADSRGNLRNNYEVFLEVIDALGGMKNETERDAYAMQLLGESATQLNPLIEAGAEKLQALAADAHEMGYVMDDEARESLVQFNDVLQKLDKQGDAVHLQFAEALLPILTVFADLLNAIPTPVLTAVIAIAGITAVVVSVSKAVRDLAGTMGVASGVVNTAFAQLDLLYIKILLIVAAITALVAVIAVLIGKGNDVTNAMNSITTATTGTIQTGNNNLPRYATGTRSAKKGFALVGENGPELISLRGGEQIYTNGQTRKILGGDTISIGQITIEARTVKEFNDIVEIARNEAVSMRQGVKTK